MNQFLLRITLALMTWIQRKTQTQIDYYLNTTGKFIHHRLTSPRFSAATLCDMILALKELEKANHSARRIIDQLQVFLRLRSFEARYASEIYALTNVLSIYEMFVETPARVIADMVKQ